MPRVKLSFWLGELAPGDEIEVTDDELRVLQRDGRVAEVLEEPQAANEQATAQPQPGPEATDAAQPEPAPEPSGRKRR